MPYPPPLYREIEGRVYSSIPSTELPEWDEEEEGGKLEEDLSVARNESTMGEAERRGEGEKRREANLASDYFSSALLLLLFSSASLSVDDVSGFGQTLGQDRGRGENMEMNYQATKKR